MANSKSHVLGVLREFLRSVKASGYSDVRVGPLTDSSSKRVVPVADLEPVIDSMGGMIVILRMSGTDLEVVDPDDRVLATLSTIA
jgi:hypothetical protein